MSRLLKYVSCTLLLIPSLALAETKGAVDWTPFFKAWENGCDAGKEETALRKNLFKYNTAKKRDVFQRLDLPAKYAQTTGKPLINRKQNPDGTDIVSIAYIPIKNGTYYGIPIAGVEYGVGEENGISYRILTFNAPYATVKSKLKSVKYRAEVVQEMDMEFRASLEKDKTQAMLICDAST